MSDKTYVFDSGANNSLSAMLPSLLQNRGIDPAYLMGMMNNGGGFGGFGGNGWNDIIALIVVAAIFGNGNFGFGNNGNNNQNSQLLASLLERNGVDIAALGSSINCSSDRIRDAIGQVSTQICNLAGQNGLSFQQVINSIQAGNNALTSQICSCCCDLKQLIGESNYLTERGFCNTNQILSQGFSSVAYETQRQTCDIEKAISASTDRILEGQRAAEMREMQDKIDALREKNAQQAVILNNAQQTSQFAAMLAPIQADLAELKCNQLPIKKIACPEQYIPLNASVNATYGLVPTCGYGLGYGLGWSGWGNNFCGNSQLWG